MSLTTANAARENWLTRYPGTMVELRARYRHLVWSNPDRASDEVYVRAILARASFYEVLDLAGVVGLERLRASWRVLQADDPQEVRFAARHLDRIFDNIQTGWDRQRSRC